MATTANLISLDEIIDGIQLLDNEAAYGGHLTKIKKRFIGLNALRELNLDVARSSKGKKLKVKANGSIELPDDYMDYTGVFIIGSNNEMIPLGHNRRINISNEPILDHNEIPILDHRGDEIYDSRDQTNSSGSSNVITDGSVRSYSRGSKNGYYGLGGGNNQFGYYRFDYEENTLQFDLRTDIEYIYLEYISNGLEGVSPQYIMVPIQVAEAMTAFIMWKSVVYQRGVSSLEKMELRRNFYMEKRKATRRMSKFIAEEARQSSRIFSQQTVTY